MHDRCLPFILAGPEDKKTVLLDHQGKSFCLCNRCPYLRQRSQTTFIKLEGFILCPDDKVFIVAFWKEDIC